MIGSLSKEQIEHVLHSAVVGRIGCYDGKDIYIIPLTFVFDGKYIYAHSHEGLKIEIMRKQPTVCFEVESIEGMTNWRCVMGMDLSGLHFRGRACPSCFQKRLSGNSCGKTLFEFA